MNSFSAAQRTRVTMLDVAQRAGVSKASVSRFIGEDRALLSAAIAERIEHAINELGYRPNQMARGLKRGRTRLIGMLVADIRNPYSIAVMHGVETACRLHGYNLVVCNTDRNDEQERRFQGRIYHPTKHWKLSPMDLQSRARWVEYSKAKDEMFAHTDIKQAPWYVVHGDDKKRARLNVIAHLLSMVDYKDLTPERVVLPPRQEEFGYVRPPMSDQTFIPEVY